MQDSRQTSSNDGETVFMLCEDSESDGIIAAGVVKLASYAPS